MLWGWYSEWWLTIVQIVYMHIMCEEWSIWNFIDDGANFRWPLVLTQTRSGANHIFLSFLWSNNFFFVCQRGSLSNAPSLNTIQCVIILVSVLAVQSVKRSPRASLCVPTGRVEDQLTPEHSLKYGTNRQLLIIMTFRLTECRWGQRCKMRRALRKFVKMTRLALMWIVRNQKGVDK